MSSTTTRVNYFERQFLRTQDFQDEQAYHLAQARRHTITQHLWGIVSGLEIKLDPADNLPVLEPGIAVDAYGRLLVLPVRHPLGPQIFDEQSSEIVELWLNYAYQETDNAPKGYVFCDDTANPYRLQEVAQVWVQAPDQKQTTDPNQRFERRLHPDSREPSELTTDEPLGQWPIYLGSINRISSKEVSYQINLSGRPYAGLVGERICAASSKAHLQLGSGAKDFEQRFGVYFDETVKDDPLGQRCGGSQANQTQEKDPVLSISNDGNTTIRANTTVQGNVRVKGGAVEFAVAREEKVRKDNSRFLFRRVTEKIEEKREKNQKKKKEEAEEKPNEFDELRIEMPERRDDVPVRVVIGKWDNDTFVHCLTIEDDGTVIVHGDLVVENPPVRFDDGLPLKLELFSKGFAQEAQAYLRAAGSIGGVVGLNSIVLPKKTTSGGRG